MEFSHAYTNRQPAGVLSRLNEDGVPVVSPDSEDWSQVKVAFIAGWATDVGSFRVLKNGCTGKKFKGYEEVVPMDEHGGPDAAMRELVEGTVDALFAYSSLIDDR